MPPLVVVVCCVGWGVFLAGEDEAGWGEWVGVLRFGHPIGEGGREGGGGACCRGELVV